jgi:glycosyltransferase involved in cell wall biosynthesis
VTSLDIGIIASSEAKTDEPFAGGMESHTVTLAEGLRRRGHRVRIHAAGDIGPPGSAGRGFTPSNAARSDVSMPEAGFMARHHAYLGLMLAIDGCGHDVVHNNSYHYLPVAMGPAARTPIVTTLHTPPTPWLESAIGCGTGHERLHWISVSATNTENWAHAPIDPVTIHNGVDLEHWKFAGRGVPGTAVWSGRIVPEKGVHLAIEAAREAGYRLNIAGPISDRGYFERQVRPELGSRDVRYLGHLDTSALVEAVGAAEVCLVTPCWEEPFGLVAAEALATGTPVAAIARGALSEVVGPCGRVAPPGDPEALARCVREAAAIPSEACRERAELYFNAERMIDRYLDVYRLAAELDPAPA